MALNFPENDEGQYFMYDKIDMKHTYWKGFAVGMVTMFALCFLIGLFVPA